MHRPGPFFIHSSHFHLLLRVVRHLVMALAGEYKVGRLQQEACSLVPRFLCSTVSHTMAESFIMQQIGLVPSKMPPAGAQSQHPRAPIAPWSTCPRVVVGQKRPPAMMANQNRENAGPGPQPLRGIPGFPTQPQQQNRNAPLGAGRLPNGKLGTLDKSQTSFGWFQLADLSFRRM